MPRRCPQLCPEVSGEPGVLVTNHFMRNTKKPHYLVKEELGTLWGTKCTSPIKQGVKQIYLVRQSIHVKIALKLEHNGKEVIKPCSRIRTAQKVLARTTATQG